MSRSVDELWELLREANGMPYGSAQIALVEQVLRHADAAGDRELAFTSRMLATTAYTYGGEVAKSFVTFSWCLADFDRDPAPFHRGQTHTLLWHFKTMVSALTKFPEVPLERTYAVLDDMERRYREGGHSMQAVYKHRFVVARHVGADAEADEWYERWMTTPRDELSDCAGCDPSTRVSYLVERRRDEEAIALAEPVLAGNLTCNEQPQGILRGLLVPYVRTGRLDAAVDAHRRAYRLVRGNLADLWDIGDHIEFCARTGNEHRGLEILQRHLDWLDRAPSPAAGMNFAAAAALLLRRLTELGHGDTPVHRRGHGDRPAGEVPAAALAEELARYASELSVRFDARNGTTEQSGRVAGVLAAQPYPVVLPLSPTDRRRAAAPAAAQRDGSAGAVQTQPAGSAAPAADAPEIPADADAATLLALAEQYELADRTAAVTAVLDAFDERFAGADLGPDLAGRRAELLSSQRWQDGDADGVIAALQQAADLHRAAGNGTLASRASAGVGLMRVLTGRADEGRGPVEADVAYQEEHGDVRQRAAAHARHALVLLIDERYDDAHAALDRADALADGLADPRLAARYAMRRAEVFAAQHRHQEAAARADRARAFYRAHGPAAQLAAASLGYARVAPDPSDAVAALDEALAIDDPASVLDARLGRARALLQLNRPADAVDDFVEAVALCAERDLEQGGAYIRHELAAAYQQAGRFVEAAEVAEEAVAALHRLGDDTAADNARYLLAGVYRALGDGDAALVLYDELVERLGAADNAAGLAQVQENAGDVLFRADRDAEAAQRFAAAADGFRAAGEPLDEVRALRRRVMALHWADDLPAAQEAVRYAQQRHADLPADDVAEPRAVWERVMLGFEASRMLMSRGRYAEALPYLSDGPERLRAIGASDDADQVAGMLGEALLRSGDPARAETLLRSTLAAMAPDAPTRSIAAQVLAEALDALGRSSEAAAVRTQYGG